MIELLKQLTQINAPSGQEEEMRQFIRAQAPAAAEIKEDALGNIIVHLPGNGKKVMFAAHMDEIGVMVTYVEDNGYLRFTNVGGVSAANALHSKVVFPGGLKGIVAAGDTKKKDLKLADMYIDIGAKNAEEAEKLAPVGTTGVFCGTFDEISGCISSKALDDRAGCYALLEALQQIGKHDSDLYFVFTVQEEIGLKGAKTAAYGIEPDIGIAVDVTACGDGIDGEKMAIKLGGGAAVKVRDSGMIAHPAVRSLIVETARENDIPFQFEVLSGGTTDASGIQITKSGVPAGAISIPCRYIHSTAEMVSAEDLQHVAQLVRAIAEKTI